MSSTISYDVQGVKKSKITGIMRHILRNDPKLKHSNKSIDAERTHLNEFLIDRLDHTGLVEHCRQIIDDEREKHGVTKGIRSDANWLTNICITPGGDIATDEVRSREFLHHAHDFLMDKYGEFAIASVIHNDETTPHLQFSFIPLQDGVLNQNAIIGGKGKLSKVHTELREYCNQNMKDEHFAKANNAVAGLSMEQYKEFKDFEKSLNEKEEKLQALELGLKEKTKTLGAKERKLNRKERELDKKDEKLQALELGLNEKTKTLGAKERKLNRKERELDKKDEKLQALELGLDEKQRKFKEQQDTFKDKLKELKDKEKEKRDKFKKQLEEFNEKQKQQKLRGSELDERERRINTQEKRLNARETSQNAQKDHLRLKGDELKAGIEKVEQMKTRISDVNAFVEQYNKRYSVDFDVDMSQIEALSNYKFDDDKNKDELTL